MKEKRKKIASLWLRHLISPQEILNSSEHAVYSEHISIIYTPFWNLTKYSGDIRARRISQREKTKYDKKKRKNC